MAYDEKKIDYSAEWKGPLKNRSCTDWPCLVIFLAFMAAWIGIGCYALLYGDIKILLAPRDSHGRKCGYDNEVINEPYLVFFDLRECLNNERKCNTPQVCREKCPSINWWAQLIEWLPIEAVRKTIICEKGIDVNVKNRTEFRSLIQEKKCAEWYLNSTSILGRCIPIRIPVELISIIDMTEKELGQVKKIVKALAWGEEILDTMISTRGTVLGLIAGSAAICLLWIFLLRWLAFPFVILSAATLCSFFSYLTYYFHERYVVEDEIKWLVLTIIFAIIAGLILLIVLCLLKRILLACQLIKEASKAVASILSSLIFPIIPWLFHLASIIYVIVIGLYLATVETLEKWEIRLLIAIHIAGFIWFYCFITALGEMILAATFATWYWTFRKIDVPFFTVAVGAWTTARYHLGTVAFGSLLITICRLIRYVLEAVRHSAREEGGLFYNLCCSYLIGCAQFLMKFLEKFLKFMNRNAYIVCAVYGKGLCSSASDALSLILRNALRVIVLNNIVSWLLWMGKIVIAVTIGGASWWFYTSTKYQTEHWWVPVVLVVVGAYLVASVFFSVYEVAVDTIFLCFLEDCERHDGSLSKPYYMSHSLRKLLHKDL